ncbi:MAG: 16S rRNA (cytosine(1402)-N(4))-methyltransferase RsmH [Myxococcaceae bacterium]
MTLAFTHTSVLLDEVVALLAPAPGKHMIDGTLGGGGHAEALLRKGASVLGVDRDPNALHAAAERLGSFPGFVARQGNFSELDQIAADRLPVEGIVLDLGVSSPQLDEPERGFSFRTEGPLDMRMGKEGETAMALIERSDEASLAKLIFELGEESFARPIARALKRTAPKTTLEAASAVASAVPRARWPTRVHVATKTFQALRMAVNDELGSLQRFLETLPSLLAHHGVAAVIAFHSLEDRAVKHAFRRMEGQCACPPGFPECRCEAKGAFEVKTRKAITASPAEVAANPRARSARLRAVEKVR